MPKASSKAPSVKKPLKKPVAPTVPRPSPGLGRGLTAIIAQGARTTSGTEKADPTHPPITSGIAVSAPDPTVPYRELSISKIIPNPRQPRLRFIEEPLDELIASIREHGVMQPITVRPKGDRFEIIAGERRFRACQKAGLATIPSVVKAVSDAEALELALIENLQRENLDPIEEARGYHQLADAFALTQEEIAKKIGKNRTSITNSLRLLELPEEIQGFISQGRISAGHAKAILGLSSPDLQKQLALRVIKHGLSVRQTEQRVSEGRVAGKKKGAVKTDSPADLSAHLQSLQDALQQKLGTKVRLHASGQGGLIEIQYYTPTDLDRILDILQIRL